MVIATYNLRAGGRVGQRIHWTKLLDDLRSDLLLVQESRHPSEYLPGDPCERYQERVVWAPVATNRWGSAVFAPGAMVTAVDCGALNGWGAAPR